MEQTVQTTDEMGDVLIGDEAPGRDAVQYQ
jgi:hypothetical protein